MGTNHDLVGVFCSHLTDLLWTPHKSQFWSRATRLQTDLSPTSGRLENVLTIQIEPEFSALSVYEVSRAIPVLLPYQNNDFRGVNKKNLHAIPIKKNCYMFMQK